jgi:flagellar motor switch/type III secretory pathway protein FliN
MSGKVRDWLPAGAATGRHARAHLEEKVASWSERWFAGASASLSSLAPCPAGGATAPPETLRIAGLALGADPRRLVLSEPDRDILEGLAAAIAADLAASLGAPAPGEGPEPSPAEEAEPAILAGASDGEGRDLLQLAVPAAALVPAIKARIPARTAQPLGDIERASGKTVTRIELRLGAASLSLAELAGLGEGDVLLLDRRVEDGVEVAAAPAASAFARGALEHTTDGSRLVLHRHN